MTATPGQASGSGAVDYHITESTGLLLSSVLSLGFGSVLFGSIFLFCFLFISFSFAFLVLEKFAVEVDSCLFLFCFALELKSWEVRESKRM